MTLLSRLGAIELTGDIHKNQDISAIDISGDFLILGADESNRIQVLQRQGDDYEVIHNIMLGSDKAEIDIEGIACERNHVYVVGSHSWKRKKVASEQSSDKSYEENREAIETVTLEPDRDRLCCITLDAQGNASTIE